jgi:nucleoside-diphosphate-sugar epimerase
VRDIHNPRWTYAASKILGEIAFANWGQEFAIARYHNVYGQAMHSKHVIPELFSKIWQGLNPLLVTSASHTRTFCHVRDAVASTIAAMEEPAAQGRVVNVGSGDDEISMGDLARRMVRISGRDIEVRDAPELPGSVSRRKPDVTFLQSLLGNHRCVSLQEGLEECWAWQRQTEWVA